METTLTLRNRLGFDDTVMWKQFCAKRLHLIHTLSLNSRKASEQEEQVRSIASDLCAEYGFSSNAQADFEKLIIAGIQSVRRNQKRLQRHAPTPSEPDQAASQQNGSTPSAPQPAAPAYGYIAQAVPAGAYGLPQHMVPSINTPPTAGVQHPQVGAAHITAAHIVQHPVQSPYMIQQSSQPPPPPLLASGISGKLDALRHLLTPYLSLGATQSSAARSGASQIAAEGLLSAAVAGAATHIGATPSQMQAMHVSLLAGTLRDTVSRAVGASSARSFIDAVGALAASPQGPSLLAALQGVLFELAMASPDVDGMLRILSTQYPSVHVIGSTSHASGTPTVHSNVPSPPHSSISPPGSASSVSQFPSIGDSTSPTTPGAARLSGTIQAPPPPQLQAPPPPSVVHLRHTQQQVAQPMSPVTTAALMQKMPSQTQQRESPSSDQAISQQPLVAKDRLVTLKFDNQQLQLTYSPLKSTPPALTEIIENARQTFRIEADRVVRVKDTQRSKIVETNAELIEAFSQPTVTLEILLPPPMLHDSNKHSRSTNFASLAPILQPSAK